MLPLFFIILAERICFFLLLMITSLGACDKDEAVNNFALWAPINGGQIIEIIALWSQPVGTMELFKLALWPSG